jgi:hypothetical protein
LLFAYNYLLDWDSNNSFFNNEDKQSLIIAIKIINNYKNANYLLFNFDFYKLNNLFLSLILILLNICQFI